MGETYDLIQQAIEQKLIVVARYNDHVREMCPHVLGLSKSGRPQALFYQFGGTSSTGISPDGSPDNWRCIPLDGLQNVMLKEGSWHTAPNHSRPQSCVKTIHVEVVF